MKRELFPVCNLGYIPEVNPEQELLQEQMSKKKKFKDPNYWDKQHNKNKFKYLERQKILIEENYNSSDSKGQRADYDDLNRSMEKQKRKEEEEIQNILMMEKEKLEREEKAKKEREKENEEKQRQLKKKEEKRNEKKEEKKPEEKHKEKNTEAKKPEEKKTEEIKK